jgi:predicted RNA-binding protein (virulence factor B family)
MLQVGQLNHLKIIKSTDFGLFLDGDSAGEILLPNRYVPEVWEVGDEIEVFIYYDSEDRLVATTLEPFAKVGEFALLKVRSLERVGAFLDWGLPKDLFLPFSEQNREIKIGHDIIVFVYLDKSGRISASMRLERYIDKELGDYQEKEQVDLFIIAKTDLGYKAIINGRHVGMLYENEVFQPLAYGQNIKGFIKKLRDDGKIDLSLQAEGHKAAGDIGQMILDLLKEKGGFLPIDDKTSAETIYELFSVSKKKYKMALGGLYKSRLITIENDGIRLAK